MGGKVRTVRARISGQVQGVGYRDWTEQRAHSLRLSGWVRNRRDGTVEAEFSGPHEDVDRMVELCRQGPPIAQVIAVAVEEVTAVRPTGFSVLPTV